MAEDWLAASVAPVYSAPPVVEHDNAFDLGLEDVLRSHLKDQAELAQAINSIPGPQAQPEDIAGAGQSIPVTDNPPPRNLAPGGLLPLNTPGAVRLRGYVDAEGNPTQDGEVFGALHEHGLLDANGELTDRGKAFAMPREDSLIKDNLPSYIIRQQAKLDDAPKTSFTEDVSAAAGSVGKALQGAYQANIYTKAAQVLFGDKTADQAMDEWTILAQNFAKGGLDTPAALGSGMNATMRKGWDSLTGDEVNYYAAKQDHDSFKQDQQDYTGAKVWGQLLGADNAVKLQHAEEQAKANLTADKAAELQEQGQAAGAIFGDPTNYATMGAGFFTDAAGKATILGKLSSTVEKFAATSADAAALDAAAAKARVGLTATQRAVELAGTHAEALAPINPERAATILAFGQKMSAAQELFAKSVPELEQAAQTAKNGAEKLAKPAEFAQKALNTAQAIQEAKAIPFKALSATADSLGDGLMKTDSTLRSQIERLGTTRSLATAVGLGHFVPHLGMLGAGTSAALASGPVLKGIANFSRILGDEMIQARGSVPFFQRVADNSAATPWMKALAHTIDTATLGGKAYTVPINSATGAVKGAAAALPITAAFQTLSDGGELSPDTLQKAAAGALVFGGTGGALGAIVNGSVKAKQAQSLGDEINFRRNLPEDQLPLFKGISKGSQRAVAAYAAAFPELHVRFNTDTSSNFNRGTNTVTINLESGRLLEPLLAHEVGHYLAVKGQLEDGIATHLIGDDSAGTGGVLRAKDGTLDPNFAQFMDKYNADAVKAGVPPVDVKGAALEYFTEGAVDHLMQSNQSGELQSMAGRTNGERIVRKLAQKVIGKSAFLQDFFYRSGGAKDPLGNMVPGNGLLADGIRELPGAKKLIRDVAADIAGRRTGHPSPPEPKIPVQLTKPLAETLIADFQTDPAGNVVVDAQGKPKLIDKATEDARATAGKEAVPAIDKALEQAAPVVPGSDPFPVTTVVEATPAAGTVQPEPIPPPPADTTGLKKQKNGTYTGTHFPEAAIDALRDSGKLHPHQVAALRMINDSVKNFTGETYLFPQYTPETIHDKNGKARYTSKRDPQDYHVIPIGHEVTKTGRIHIVGMDLKKLAENVRLRAESAPGKSLYGGNQVEILKDMQAVGELHRQGKKTDDYFATKYGPRAPEYKNFINSTFGHNRTKGHLESNPVFNKENLTAQGVDNIYKTFSLDRLNQITRLQGRTPIYYGYEAVKNNWLPNGVPELPR